VRCMAGSLFVRRAISNGHRDGRALASLQVPWLEIIAPYSLYTDGFAIVG
jgi:hypothetical protein